MKTRPSSIPKHPAQVQWMHIHPICDSSARWQTKWAKQRREHLRMEELCKPIAWLSSQQVYYREWNAVPRVPWNSEDAFLCVFVDRFDKEREGVVCLCLLTYVVSISQQIRCALVRGKEPRLASSISLTSKKRVRCTAVLGSCCTTNQQLAHSCALA